MLQISQKSELSTMGIVNQPYLPSQQPLKLTQTPASHNIQRFSNQNVTYLFPKISFLFISGLKNRSLTPLNGKKDSIGWDFLLKIRSHHN